MLLAVDPGRFKCGLAVAGDDGACLERRIVPPERLAETVREILAARPIDVIVLGDGTTSRETAASLREALGGGAPPLVTVDERGSTLEARQLYFRDHPPRGIWKLVPLSIQTPPVDLDDYAALVLARRWRAMSRQENR